MPEREVPDMSETPFVPAYVKRTGRKVVGLVPPHFVDELAHITGLSATPRGRADAANQTPAAPAEDTHDKNED